MTRPSPADATAAADALLADPVAAANRLPGLVAMEAEFKDEPSAAVAAAAVRGAMLVFQAAGARGELEPPPPQAEESGGGGGTDATTAPGAAAEAAYRAWLRARFADHGAALRRLLAGAGGAHPALQAAAARAALEAARTPVAGALDVSSLAAAVDALLTGDDACDAAVGCLAGAAAAYVDVRYAVWRGAARAAARLATKEAGGGAADDGGSDDDDDDDDDDDGGGGGRLADAGRTLVDLLTAVPTTGGGAADVDGGGDDGRAGDAPASSLPSFCGAAALGGAPASTGADGSRARRKRRKEGGGGPASAPPAAWASADRRRAAAGAAWSAALRAPLPLDAHTKLLAALPAAMPGLGRPLRLCDALFDAASAGGPRALAALRALFELVVRHGLEYPRAYDALYGLLTRDALAGPSRAAFAGLADAFLASPLVPAYSAAAFAKRYARLALTAALPPPATEAALAFVHNIVRRHRACGGMLHRPPPTAAAGGDGASADAAAAADPYAPDAPDPASSRAVESSLWEVAHLARSPHARVAAAARALLAADPARRAGGEIDFASAAAGTYGTAVAEGLGRRVKRPPGVVADGGGRDAARLWGGADGVWAGWA